MRPGHTPPESKPPHSITPRWARSALRSPSRVRRAHAPTESPQRFPRRPSAERDPWPSPAPTSAAARHRVPDSRCGLLAKDHAATEGEAREPTGSSSIPGSLRLGRGAAMWLMPGARSKRCRENRPLTGVGRLAERERPGVFSGSSMQDQVALGAQRSPTPVKGGIARAPGSPKRGDGLAAPCTCGGLKRSG